MLLNSIFPVFVIALEAGFLPEGYPNFPWGDCSFMKADPYFPSLIDDKNKRFSEILGILRNLLTCAVSDQCEFCLTLAVDQVHLVPFCTSSGEIPF